MRAHVRWRRLWFPTRGCKRNECSLLHRHSERNNPSLVLLPPDWVRHSFVHIPHVLTICDVVTVKKAWSLPLTRQQTSRSLHSRLPPSHHHLTVPLRTLPTPPARLARVPGQGQERHQALLRHLPRPQNPMAQSLPVHVQVAFSP